MDCVIPSTFTQEQARWILELNQSHSRDRRHALRVLWEQAPGRCSKAQALCIEEMMSLKAGDFRATLADAMEDCPMRDQLRRSASIEQLA